MMVHIAETMKGDNDGSHSWTMKVENDQCRRQGGGGGNRGSLPRAPSVREPRNSAEIN